MTDEESQPILLPPPLMTLPLIKYRPQNSPQKSTELQPESSTHPQLNSNFKCSVEAGVCESQSLTTAIDRGIMENVSQGNMVSNVEQSDMYSEIYQRVKDALQHEAQGGLPSPLKTDSSYPSDNMIQKGDKVTTQILPVRGLNDSVTSSFQMCNNPLPLWKLTNTKTIFLNHLPTQLIKMVPPFCLQLGVSIGSG
ncbi:hypothetical protein Tco_0027867 [Tanacetum coccineum]